jgi:hypothetical protein
MPSTVALRVVALVVVATIAVLTLLHGHPPQSFTEWLAPVGPAVAVASGLLCVFDRFAWRWPGLRKLVGRPILHGTWHGELASRWGQPDHGPTRSARPRRVPRRAPALLACDSPTSLRENRRQHLCLRSSSERMTACASSSICTSTRQDQASATTAPCIRAPSCSAHRRTVMTDLRASTSPAVAPPGSCISTGISRRSLRATAPG